MRFFKIWLRKMNQTKYSSRDYRFFAEIVKLSYAKDWEEAKKEWSEEKIYKVPTEEALSCICGHYPILNIIQMKNFVTQNMAIVGNCCIDRFHDDYKKFNKIFSGLKRNKINKIIIDYANKKQWITPREYDFLNNVFRKRVLTEPQKKWLDPLKQKIFNHLKKEESEQWIQQI